MPAAVDVERPKTPLRPTQWPPTPPNTGDSTVGMLPQPLVLRRGSPVPPPSPTKVEASPIEPLSNYFDVLSEAVQTVKEYSASDHITPHRYVVKHFSIVRLEDNGQDVGNQEKCMVLVADQYDDQVVHRSVTRLSEDLEHVDLRPLPTKRPRPAEAEEELVDSEVTYTGTISASADGVVCLGSPSKRRRPDAPPSSVTDESELQEVELVGSRQVMTTTNIEARGCATCGCFCSRVDPNSRGQGSGSTTLSPQVRGRLLALLLNSGSRLLDDLSRRDRRIQSWKDVAEMVGAKREDFDRVRHAASWMQDNLPAMKAAGRF